MSEDRQWIACSVQRPKEGQAVWLTFYGISQAGCWRQGAFYADAESKQPIPAVTHWMPRMIEPTSDISATEQQLRHLKAEQVRLARSISLVGRAVKVTEQRLERLKAGQPADLPPDERMVGYEAALQDVLSLYRSSLEIGWEKILPDLDSLRTSYRNSRPIIQPTSIEDGLHVLGDCYQRVDGSYFAESPLNSGVFRSQARTWRACQKEMPQAGQAVWFINLEVTYAGWWRDGNFWTDDYYLTDVTHWMPRVVDPTPTPPARQD